MLKVARVSKIQTFWLVIMVSNFNSYLIILSLSLLITSCVGGGGGGGGIDTSGTCRDGNSSSFCTSEFHANYGLKNIKAYEAYDDGYFGSGVNVAVMDGGFDTDHTDINFQNIEFDEWEHDDDADSSCPNCSAISSHGTHVAGIIAAKRNSSGMHGVAPAATVVPVRIFNDSGTSASDISGAINFSGQNANIINNSWGTSQYTDLATCVVNGVSYTCRGIIPASSSGGMDSSAEQTQWNQLATQDDAVSVFAAGNRGANSETGQIRFYNYYTGAFLTTYSSSTVYDAGLISSTNLSSYEGRYPLYNSNIADYWINVVSVDSNNVISSFSNGCGDSKNFCIAAPGEDIYAPTASSTSSYGTKSGTSMAAPHVSGALALMKNKWPNLTAAQLVDIILNNATDLGASGTDSVYGVGLLNLNKSMQASGALEVTYASDDGTLKKFLVSDTSIISNKLMSNLDNNIPIGVVDEYERVYSVKLNDMYSNSQSSFSDQSPLYVYERNLTDKNRYVSAVNDGMFFIDNNIENIQNLNFDAKNRLYEYDLLSYEKLIFGNQQKIHIPISNSFTLSTDSQEFDNMILKTNFYFNKNKYNLDLETGLFSESGSVLGNTFTGAFKTNKSLTYFSKLKNSYSINEDLLKLNLSYGITQVEFENNNFIDMSDLITLESTLAYEKIFDKSKFSTSLNLPMYISKGHAQFTNVSGYDELGQYKNGTTKIDLSQRDIYGSLNFYYDINLSETSDFGVSYSLDTLNDQETNFIYRKKF